MAGPYTPSIKQNDENFRKQLIGNLGDIDSRLTALEGTGGSAAAIIELQREVMTLQLLRSISSVATDAVGFLDDYQDQSGIDAANSTGVIYLTGDVSNAQAAYVALPNMTSNSAPSGYSATAYDTHTAGMADQGSGYSAFDNNSSTRATLGSNAPSISYPHIYQINCPNPIKLTGYAPNFYSQSGYYCGNYTLEGAPTPSGPWTVLDTVTNNGVAQPAAKSFSPAITAYKSIRLDVTSMTAGANVGSSVIDLGLQTSAQAASMGAMSLRSIKATLKYTPARVFLYAAIKLGGGVINTDVQGFVTRDGATYTQGTFALLFTRADGYGIYELQDGSGKPGVDVSGQPSGQTIGYKLTTTAAYRQDFAVADCRGA